MVAMAEVNASKPLDINALLGESKAAIHAPLPHFFSSQRHMEPIEVRVGSGSVAIPAREFHIDRTASKGSVFFGSAGGVSESFARTPAPEPYSPVSPILAVSGLGEIIAGEALRRTGKKIANPRMTMAGGIIEGAGFFSVGTGLAACAPLEVSSTPTTTETRMISLTDGARSLGQWEKFVIQNADGTKVTAQMSSIPICLQTGARDAIQTFSPKLKDQPVDMNVQYGFCYVDVSDSTGKKLGVLPFLLEKQDGSPTVAYPMTRDRSVETQEFFNIHSIAGLEPIQFVQEKLPNQNYVLGIYHTDTKVTETLAMNAETAATPQPDSMPTMVPGKVYDTAYTVFSGANLLPAFEAIYTPTAPVETPTTEASPTPTENPLAGAPEGTTGKNSKGEWIKVNPETNVTYVYKDMMIGKEHVQGWYKDIIVNPTYEGGIPLIDQSSINYDKKMTLHVYCEEGLSCPTVQHTDNIPYSEIETTFPRLLMNVIIQRALGKQRLTPTEINTFWTNVWEKDKAEIPLTTANGDSYVYKIKPGSSMNIYLMKNDLSNPDFSRSFLHASISGDDQGDVNVVEYSPKPIESMSHNDFVSYFFTYPFTIFFTDDMSQGSVLNYTASPALGNLVAWTIKGANPYFVLQP